MAGFARGPDITARLCDVIEYLQSDAVQEQAELDATFLLKELNRLLADEHICMDQLVGKLERLIREVRATCRDPERRPGARPEAIQGGAGVLDKAGEKRELKFVEYERLQSLPFRELFRHNQFGHFESCCWAVTVASS